MSKRFLFGLGVLLVTVLAGCNSQGDAGTPPAQAKASSAASAPPATSSLTLPEKTNNAWEMNPFVLKDLQDQKHSLSDWKGKVIMMNFWASWCAPCQYEIPEFVQYQKEYANNGLQVIGIGVDEKRKLANVARTLQINYPVLVLEPSAAGHLMGKWGNDSGIIPYTVVIAKEGRIKYIHRGQMQQEDFDTYVLPLLK